MFKIFFGRIVVATTVFVITLTDIVRKDNLSFCIDIFDKASRFSTTRTTNLAAVFVFLQMKSVLTHGYPN